MSVWDQYDERMGVRGATQREAYMKRETRRFTRKPPDSLSYQSVFVYDAEHGYDVAGITPENKPLFARTLTIIDSDNLDEKKVVTLPGEDIDAGCLVEWMGGFWLVTEKDANTTLYTRAKMQQCNYLLRWTTAEPQVYEQWCVVEDGTKYLTGEFEDRHFVATRGDARIAVTLAKNHLTSAFNRESRFIIDIEASDTPMVFQNTKPLKVGHVYNDIGVFKFVMSEGYLTEDDNPILRAADYYKYFPRSPKVDTAVPSGINKDERDQSGKKVWL